jgi:hypothetical protein
MATSCSSINLKQRKDRDIYLDHSNFNQLTGKYSTYRDYFNANSILSPFSSVRLDSLINDSSFKINVEANGLDELRIGFFLNDSLITRTTLKGKYRRGYFSPKRKWIAKMAVGPLVWVFGSHTNLIGLTNENDLIIVSSRGGLSIVIAMPVFAAGGQFDEVFKREELSSNQ